MKRKKEKVIIAILCIIIVILLILIILLGRGTISFKEKENNCDNTNYESSENGYDNTNYESNENFYVTDAKTEDKINLIHSPSESNNDIYNFEIVNGDIKINDKTFTIPDEKIKYFYYDYYQSGTTTIIYYLTEKGSVYMTCFNSSEIASGKNAFDLLSKFEKFDTYEGNITDIVLVPNKYYGKIDELTGHSFPNKFYRYAMTEFGQLFLLDYQRVM